MSQPPLRAAVLLSGGGRTLENLCEHAGRGDLACELGLVISNREDAFGLERARNHGLPTLVVDPRRELEPEALFRLRLSMTLEIWILWRSLVVSCTRLPRLN